MDAHDRTERERRALDDYTTDCAGPEPECTFDAESYVCTTDAECAALCLTRIDHDETDDCMTTTTETRRHD